MESGVLPGDTARAMSQENVEIVRRYYEATQRLFAAYWNEPRSAVETLRAGDAPPDAVEMVRVLHPNVEWTTALTGVTYRSYDGLAIGFDEMVGAAQDYRVEVQEVTDLADDRVLAVLEVGMKGKASEIDVNAAIFVAVTVRDGLIIRMDEHLERTEALEAAGLKE
jgi:ketosteroid isomerase-like protein